MPPKKTFPRHAFQARPPARGDRPPPSSGGGDGGAATWKSAGGALFSVVVVIGAVALLKFQVADIYFIPSGSMETALYGRPDGGDRIACAKIPYRFRAPYRWEIGVFHFPAEYGAERLADFRVPGGRSEDAWRAEWQRQRHRLIRYRGQNYIKRLVGMPGETIRIARGDLWRKKDDGGYERLVKPPDVQRGMWIPVYAADFATVPETHFDAFWTRRAPPLITKRGTPSASDAPGDAREPDVAFTDAADGTRVLRMRAEAARVAQALFRPRVRNGLTDMRDAPGVVDRYVVRQPVRFYCDPEPRDESAPAGCGSRFMKTVVDQGIVGTCPRCGRLALENDVEFYHRRSSLPATTAQYGTARMDTAARHMEKEKTPRGAPYHVVGDLRVETEVRWSTASDALASTIPGEALLTLFLERTVVQASLSPDGAVRLFEDGRERAPTATSAPAASADAGAWRAFELHRVDGRLRVLVDGAVLIDQPAAFLRDDEDPERRVAPNVRDAWTSSGLALGVRGGTVEWRRVRVDRDVHYFSGVESSAHGGAEAYAMMGGTGEIVLREKEYLALGDNAGSSLDSRDWGPVPERELVGTAMATWWPPHRIHGLNGGVGRE